eukprot:1161480-Pelagomonas_calceolata.AAC.5
MVGILPEGMAMLKALNLLMMKILENSDRYVHVGVGGEEEGAGREGVSMTPAGKCSIAKMHMGVGVHAETHAYVVVCVLGSGG